MHPKKIPFLFIIQTTGNNVGNTVQLYLALYSSSLYPLHPPKRFSTCQAPSLNEVGGDEVAGFVDFS